MARQLLALVGILAGIVAVRTGGLPTDLAIGDAAAGFALVAAGWLAAGRQAGRVPAVLLSLAGVTWFVASLLPGALFLHRAPLVHLVATDRRARLDSAPQRVAVGAVYVVVVLTSVGLITEAWLVVAAGLVVTGAGRLLRDEPQARRASLVRPGAAIAFGAVLLSAATARALGADVDRGALLAYDLVLIAIAAAISLDLVVPRRTDPVTRFVVDLGDDALAGTVRDRLARALGDPELVLAFCAGPACEEYVDETGLPVDIKPVSRDVSVTAMIVGGRRTGVLVHDPAILDDPRSIELIAGATELARTNAELQRDVRRRVREMAASRTRLVASADAQRRRIEAAIRSGPADGLDRARRRLAEAADETGSASLEQVVEDVAAAREELLAFARGVHPEALREHGLARAVGELAARAGCEVEVDPAPPPYDSVVESTLYFVASEAITNAVKHAAARRIRVGLRQDGADLVLRIVDDGTGGARAGAEGGLRGIADRLEALGGSLVLESEPDRGTRLEARLPVESARRALRGAGSPVAIGAPG